MINLRVFAGVLAVASLTAGCASSSSSSPSSPSTPGGSTAITSEQLAGTWNFSSVQPAGQSERQAPAGTRLTLTFDNGRLSTRAACNSCAGSFALSGQTLTAGPALACTKMWCEAIEFDDVYTTVLGGASTAKLAGGTLELSSTRGVLRFTR